ncbi:hypothetical protein AV654_32450 [Paenibacillus elgii]|uniref:Uncharacterized protein n=1 Tax=Paenibacillus elgii TaxID=189691 RepID=A0A163UJ01_9BACL|nr:hypothetical protein AV654_32450 [Paenibacillus elgii]
MLIAQALLFLLPLELGPMPAQQLRNALVPVHPTRCHLLLQKCVKIYIKMEKFPSDICTMR